MYLCVAGICFGETKQHCRCVLGRNIRKCGQNVSVQRKESEK